MYTLDQMKSINERLKAASDAYYNQSQPIMSDKEYDALYDKLVEMERESGQLLPDSVTQNVGAVPTVVSSLKKVTHKEKALSLDKTKDRNALASWLGNQDGCMSWKLDGLTIVATYNGGKLVSAVTRGNGEVGEDITHNAPFIKGLPQAISITSEFTVRGEALMTFADFDKVNATLPAESKYANPRNLASGTVRALDSKVVRDRGITFFAFESVTPLNNSFNENLNQLKNLGFGVVPHVKVNNKYEGVQGQGIFGVRDAISYFEQLVKTLPYPTDGLVLQIDDIAYGKSLGTTGRFPRSGKAFKWQDETAETTIRKIEWQASRTGLINPVAVFDPIELEGTTVRRATANNISFMNKLHISVGSVITVYKANMIIPTIDANIKPGGAVVFPAHCPSCGGATQIRKTAEAEVLYCANPDCPAKNLKHFTHFVSRDAMNIMGLAESTISMLIDNGFIQNYYDLYNLKNRPEVARLENFGQGSYNNLIQAIENSRNVKLGNFLYAFGIEMVGKTAAKDIANHVKTVQALVQALDNGYDFRQIEGIGDKTNQSLIAWWRTQGNRQLFISLAQIMNFATPQVVTPQVTNTQNGGSQGSSGIAGKVFCVTGSVNIFPNRNAVGEYIEARGGRLASSVSAKTDYLVTNDTNSGSAKNKKAQELGKPILTEQQLIDLGGGYNG